MYGRLMRLEKAGMVDRDKLHEALYFLRGMRREEQHRVHFRYELSAFLSACKSYAYALGVACGRGWYKSVQKRAEAGEFPMVAYYLKKRDVNVHEGMPHTLQMGTIRHEGDPFGPIEMNFDQYGNIVGITQRGPDGNPVEIPYTAQHIHTFVDRYGPAQDIPSECDQLIKELIAITDEADEYLRQHPA
jgi:hypothetical protein